MSWRQRRHRQHLAVEHPAAPGRHPRRYVTGPHAVALHGTVENAGGPTQMSERHALGLGAQKLVGGGHDDTVRLGVRGGSFFVTAVRTIRTRTPNFAREAPELGFCPPDPREARK